MKITYIRVEIKPTGPWRIGAAGQVRDTVETLRGPDGKPFIPASSLAGAFSHFIPDELREKVMGRTETVQIPQQADKRVFWASDLWFLGAELFGEVETRTRTATAISRIRRAARNHGSHKVDEVYGTEVIRLYLRHVGDPTDVLGQLKRWPVTIGGCVSTGMGAAHVQAIRYRTLDLTDRDDLLAKVSGQTAGPAGIDELLRNGKTEAVDESKPDMLLRATITIDLLNVPVENGGAEIRPEDFWFHGTRWKGIIRSRVEYIGRSLGLAVCGTEEDEWHGCGTCAVCEVFGSSDTGVARVAFGFTKLQNVTQTDRSRAAIDRFTGGAADNKLFPERTLSEGGLEFMIRRLRPIEERHTWVAKALLLALQDMHEGFVGIGARTATGLGQVTLGSVSLDGELATLVGMTRLEIRDAPRITQHDLDLDATKELSHA